LLFDYGGVKSQGRVHPGPGWLHVDLTFSSPDRPS
jgi:hypothetical protein